MYGRSCPRKVASSSSRYPARRPACPLPPQPAASSQVDSIYGRPFRFKFPFSTLAHHGFCSHTEHCFAPLCCSQTSNGGYGRGESQTLLPHTQDGCCTKTIIRVWNSVAYKFPTPIGQSCSLHTLVSTPFARQPFSGANPRVLNAFFNVLFQSVYS